VSPSRAPAASESAHRPLTTADVIATSAPADWRPLDPQNTLYLELPTGRVIIELNTEFAPHHAANIEALAREGYYNGTSIVRSQDNYVVQWADPTASVQSKTPRRHWLPSSNALRGVFLLRRWWIPTPTPRKLDSQTGFLQRATRSLAVHGLVHCYGMVGAGRDNDVDSGGGTELYVVTGHAPVIWIAM